MRSNCSRRFILKLLFVFLLFLALSEAAKNNDKNRTTKNNFKNYGKYGSGKQDENVCTCQTNSKDNTKKETPATLEIQRINLCDNVKIPKDWD